MKEIVDVPFQGPLVLDCLSCWGLLGFSPVTSHGGLKSLVEIGVIEVVHVRHNLPIGCLLFLDVRFG